MSQGYVERLTDDHDGRVVLASLTETGAAAVERATSGLNEVFAAPGLSPSQTRDLTRLLSLIRSAGGDVVHPDLSAPH